MLNDCWVLYFYPALLNRKNIISKIKHGSGPGEILMLTRSPSVFGQASVSVIAALARGIPPSAEPPRKLALLPHFACQASP